MLAETAVEHAYTPSPNGQYRMLKKIVVSFPLIISQKLNWSEDKGITSEITIKKILAKITRYSLRITLQAQRLAEDLNNDLINDLEVLNPPRSYPGPPPVWIIHITHYGHAAMAMSWYWLWGNLYHHTVFYFSLQNNSLFVNNFTIIPNNLCKIRTEI